jgi:hypothetical protein
MENCGILGCNKPADFEVILYDVYVRAGHVFFQRDVTCPFLCSEHMSENENHASGIRAPRQHVRYPYSNQNGAQGFTIYRPLTEQA